MKKRAGIGNEKEEIVKTNLLRENKERNKKMKQE